MQSPHQIYLAPFQSITTHTFRRVYSNHFKAISKYYTPFFSKIDHDSRLSSRKEQEIQHLTEGSPQVVPQILSKDPVEILRFARICESRGFKELNWNLGCPFPQVADKKRGSGILPYPELVDEILDKVMPDMPLQFSIKCRLGYSSQEEIIDLIPIFNRYPINELTVHGRIGKQLYSGASNHDMLAVIKPLITVPFVHNGDVFSVADFESVLIKIPDNTRWMIGRGILYNPFLPYEILKIEAPDDKMAKLYAFMSDLYRAYRNDMHDRLTLLNVLKEYWDYLANYFESPQKVTRFVKKVKNFNEYEEAVKRVFDLPPK
jgi:tRNA-dihydrouridine synthase B